MTHWLGLLAVLFAFSDWIMKCKAVCWFRNITKPAVLLCLIGWLLMSTCLTPIGCQDLDQTGLTWILLGLFLFLVGEIVFMMSIRIIGLWKIFFLTGYISYIFSFGRILPAKSYWLPGWILMIFIGLVSARYFRKLTQGLDTQWTPRLVLAIGTNIIIISGVLLAALNTLLNTEWHYSSSIIVCVGALILYIFDFLSMQISFGHLLLFDHPKAILYFHFAQIMLVFGTIIQYLYY